VTVTGDDGEPFVLTGSTLRFTASIDRGPVIAKVSGPYSIENILGGANNQAQIHLVPADTNTLPAPVLLEWDVELTDTQGRVSTVDSGRLLLEADVSR
jgi:hypothetical protein